MKQTLFLLLLAICAYPAAGQSIDWRAGAGHADIGRQLSVLEDKTGSLTIQQVSDPALAGRFTRSQQSILHFGFTNAIVWLRLTVNNPTNDSLLLELNHAFISDAELYVNTNHQWFSIRSGFHVPLGQKPVVNAEQVFPLPAGHHEYYLRMQPYSHAIPVSLWEKSSFHVKTSRQKFIYGVYTGLLFFAIVINIFLFFTFRRWYYLLYSILVFFYLLSSALVMEGFAVYFFPTIDLMYWHRIVPVLDMPALLFYLLSFLEVKRYDRQLYRLVLSFSILLLAYVSVLTFLPMMPVLIANQALAVFIFLLAITIGIRTGRRGNRLGYYFVIAYAIWFVLICTELVYIQTGKPPHISDISYVSLAIFIEAFLLAYLLIQRFQWEKKEDERRQAEMQARINKMHQEFQHEMLSSKLEMQEQTFQEISQEIHDNIGQILSLAKLHIATMDAAGSNILENKIRDSKALVSKAIHDLRHLSHRLNTDYIAELGFDTAVKREIDTITRSGAYETKYAIEGSPYRFDQQKELILFRIVQELLNNILKHARAKTITVELNYGSGGLRVAIRDDGQGFDRGSLEPASANGNGPHPAEPVEKGPHPAADSHGLGIKSMYHRARLIGAGFQLTSAVGAGTVATIDIPFHSTNDNTPLQPAKNGTL